MFQDLKSKLKENDPQINTGLQKFIDEQLPNDADQFLVKSKSDLDTTYLVDTALGTCSCPHGKDGSLMQPSRSNLDLHVTTKPWHACF